MPDRQGRAGEQCRGPQVCGPLVTPCARRFLPSGSVVSAMAPSPGTPGADDRPRQRSPSPRPRSSQPSQPMQVDDNRPSRVLGCSVRSLGAFAATLPGTAGGSPWLRCKPTLIPILLARYMVKYWQTGSIPTTGQGALSAASASPPLEGCTQPAGRHSELLRGLRPLKGLLLTFLHFLPSKRAKPEPSGTSLQLLARCGRACFHEP